MHKSALAPIVSRTLFSTYADSFDAVWATAVSLELRGDATILKKGYHDETSAPKANSIVPAATEVIENADHEVLMIERTDNDLWALPGGAQDISKSAAEAAQREVIKETGIEIEITGLSGIYSDPRHAIADDNGEVRQEFSGRFLAKMTGEELRASSGSRQASQVPASQLENLDIPPSMRLRVVHGLEDHRTPYLG